MSQKAHKQDLKSFLDQQYDPPATIQRRPNFNLATIETIITSLDGTEKFDYEYYRNQLFGYKLFKIITTILWFRYVAAVLIPIDLVVLANEAQNGTLRSEIGNKQINALIILVIIAGLVYLIHLLVKFDRSFYRCTTKAEREAYKSGGSAMIRCFNLGGKAARNLYKSLQESGQSWTAPPAISDRALALSYPLIDVTIEYHANAATVKSACRSYAKFLHFSSALMAADRVDLIPQLRDVFDQSDLPRRDLGESGAIPDRYAHFLDPMRQYNRWSLVRDYLYPLGTWLSFAVSLTALLISLAR